MPGCGIGYATPLFAISVSIWLWALQSRSYLAGYAAWCCAVWWFLCNTEAVCHALICHQCVHWLWGIQSRISRSGRGGGGGCDKPIKSERMRKSILFSIFPQRFVRIPRYPLTRLRDLYEARHCQCLWGLPKTHSPRRLTAWLNVKYGTSMRHKACSPHPRPRGNRCSMSAPKAPEVGFRTRKSGPRCSCNNIICFPFKSLPPSRSESLSGSVALTRHCVKRDRIRRGTCGSRHKKNGTHAHNAHLMEGSVCRGEDAGPSEGRPDTSDGDHSLNHRSPAQRCTVPSQHAAPLCHRTSLQRRHVVMIEKKKTMERIKATQS